MKFELCSSAFITGYREFATYLLTQQMYQLGAKAGSLNSPIDFLANAIISDKQLKLIDGRGVEGYVYFANSIFWKSIFQCIGEQFIHNQSKGNGRINIQF